MKKLLFKIRHRKMKKHSFPFKLYVDQSAARFSHFLAKKEGKKLIRAEYLAEECKDLKNQIDDYGKEGWGNFGVKESSGCYFLKFRLILQLQLQ